MLRPNVRSVRFESSADAERSMPYEAIPGAEASQFPIIHCGATGFVDWNLDADDRAVVAGLRFDPFGGAAGNFWICKPDTDAGVGVRRRICGRSLQPGPRGDCNPEGFHVAGISSGWICADA